MDHPVALVLLMSVGAQARPSESNGRGISLIRWPFRHTDTVTGKPGNAQGHEHLVDLAGGESVAIIIADFESCPGWNPPLAFGAAQNCPMDHVDVLLMLQVTLPLSKPALASLLFQGAEKTSGCQIRNSEFEPHSQLKDSGKIRLRRDLPEGRRIHIRLWSIELRCVGQVENLASELRFEPLQRVALEHRKIDESVDRDIPFP